MEKEGKQSMRSAYQARPLLTESIDGNLVLQRKCGDVRSSVLGTQRLHGVAPVVPPSQRA